MSSKDKNYHVKYTFRSINSESTEFEYYEWLDVGELEDPFAPEILQKLKFVLEAQKI